MKERALFVIVCAAALLAAGCTSEDFVRTEGVTAGVGNAIAADTAMQMVDPWRRGVQNTDLLTPAELPPPSRDAAASKATAAASVNTTNN